MPAPRSIGIASAVLSASLLAPPAFAIDVDFVAITSGSNRTDDVLVDYFASFEMEAFDVAAAAVYRPGDPRTLVCTMVSEGDNDWNCDRLGFSSLNDICNTIGFGDFIIEMEDGLGGTDELTVFFDPGCVDPFSGYPDITAPLPGGTVPPVPEAADFCWDCSASGTCGPGDYVASIFSGDVDIAVDGLLETGVPTCWDPGICLFVSSAYEFEVSALQIYAEFETRFTQAGDEFIYVSAFEAQNSTPFQVTSSSPAGPPAVPDGDGGSQPVIVGKIDPAGNDLQIFYDPESCCSIVDHHVVYGSRNDLPGAVGGAFSFDGSECAIGATGSFAWFGSPTPPAGDMVWWLIVGNDASTVEGSFGQDSALNERLGPGAGGISSQCGFTTRDLANTCGR